MTTTWKSIGSGYQISSDGRVCDETHNEVHQSKINGFLSVHLKNMGTQLVHTLMYQTFIEGTDKYICHLDGDKSNNSLNNLYPTDWDTFKQEALQDLTRYPHEPIQKISVKKHEVLAIYETIFSAIKDDTKVDIIRETARRNRNNNIYEQAYGYIWMFIDTDEIWTPITDYEVYEVSTYGRLWDARTRNMFTPQYDKKQNRMFVYLKGVCGGKIRPKLDKIVIGEFIGYEPIQIKYLNGDINDCSLSNLYYERTYNGEEWRYIPNFSRYKASDDGQIFSIHQQSTICPSKYGSNKLVVKIQNDQNKYEHTFVDTLVFKTFYNYFEPDVIHKDGDNENNHIDNLQSWANYYMEDEEWCDISEFPSYRLL